MVCTSCFRKTCVKGYSPGAGWSQGNVRRLKPRATNCTKPADAGWARHRLMTPCWGWGESPGGDLAAVAREFIRRAESPVVSELRSLLPHYVRLSRTGAKSVKSLTVPRFISYEPLMATAQWVMSVVVDRDLHQRLRAEAAQRGKSVSRYVRELLEEHVRPPRRRAGRRSALLKLCGLAHGELVISDIDRELYGG